MFLTKKNQSYKSEIISFLIDIVTIVVIVFVVKSFFIVPFIIHGPSMLSSYYDKEFIIVDRISYILGDPKRGDAIVFRPGVDKEKEYFLKRIIGMPGDKVKIEKGKVFVQPKNKKEFIELQETYLNGENQGKTYLNVESKTYIIPEGKYFVMGDNRQHSTDSRQCFQSCLNRGEFITHKDMVGKILLDIGYFNIFTFSFQHPNLKIKTFPRFFSSPSKFTYKELEE